MLFSCNILIHIFVIFWAINRLSSANFMEIRDSTPDQIHPSLGDVPETQDMSEDDVAAETIEGTSFGCVQESCDQNGNLGTLIIFYFFICLALLC